MIRAFKYTQQTFACNLEWIFSPLLKTINFLDLNIHLEPNLITTTIFEKALNLYLYIPPHSSHTATVQQGLVTAGVHRILTLISRLQDQKTAILRFYDRLIARGYSSKVLKKLFDRAFAVRKRNQLKRKPIVEDVDSSSYG